MLTFPTGTRLISGLIGLSIALSSSCAQTRRIRQEKLPISDSSSLQTLVILGTNDIHGALAPEGFKTKDAEPLSYLKGGASIFGSQLAILEKEYGQRLIWLDAGDQFQGSIDSNLEEGKPVVEFFNTLGLDAATIGNHEFDFGPVGAGADTPATRQKGADLRGALKARIAEAKYPYLAANIFERKTGQPGIPGTRPSMILDTGRLKVGILGLSTEETPTSTRPEYVKDLEFRDLAKVTQTEAAKLRAQGAHVVIVLAHAGVWCNFAERSGKPIQAPLVKSEQTLQSACEGKDEISQMLKRVPPGTVDAVVSGHTHSLVHHWIEGVPVIQAGTRLQYFNLIYLTYDFEKRALARDRTRIEGPLSVCPQVFENQDDCIGDRMAPPEGRGPLVQAEFRDHTVRPDLRVETALKPYFDRTEAEKKRKVGEVAQKIEHLRTQESPLGNLVADAARAAVGADMAIVNAGGIRANLESGELRYEHVFRALPFDNFVSLVRMKGRELRQFIQIAESGARGFFPISGLHLKVIDLKEEPWSKDLDQNGKVEPWEMDRLVEVRLEDGRELDPQATYSVATIDFLVQGGDSMGWLMQQIPQERINLVAGPMIRDAVVDWIGKFRSPLNSPSEPLVNPAKPRIQAVHRPARKSKKRPAKTQKRRRSR